MIRFLVDCDERDCKHHETVYIGAKPGEGFTWARIELQIKGWTFRNPKPSDKDQRMRARCPSCNKKVTKHIENLRAKRKEMKHGVKA